MTHSVPPQSRPKLLWFDVGDLLWWLDHHNHVTGIQRAAFSILCVLKSGAVGPYPVRYCRFIEEHGFLEVGPATLDHYIAKVAGSKNLPDADEELGAWGRSKQAAKRLLEVYYGILPKELSPAYRAFINAGVGWMRAHLQFAGKLARGRSKNAGNSSLAKRHLNTCNFAQGDVLLNLGTSWVNPGYTQGVKNIKAEFGIAFVSMIYDLIPWLLPGLTKGSWQFFNPWIRSTVQLSDLLLAISDNTKNDLINFMGQNHVRQPSAARAPGSDAAPRIEVVRLGDVPLPSPELSTSEIRSRLPFTEQPYVLSVGTIELRKNHRLIFNVWKRLLDQHGTKTPSMLWVGKEGWFSEDLLEEVEVGRYLDGKLIILGYGERKRVSEAELSYLYQNCLFTVFPSLYEGWGLPVAESLSYGKYCVASNASSIPEIAGNLIDYHAPDDGQACYRLVEKAIFDTDFRRGKEMEIRTRFKPQGWEDCTRRILQIIDLPAGGGGETAPSTDESAAT